MCKSFFVIIICMLNLSLTLCANAQQGQEVSVAEILGERKEYYFDDDELYHSPEGFFSTLTGKGNHGGWKVIEKEKAPSADNVLVQVKMDETINRFPLLILDGVDYKDAMAHVKFRAEEGTINQAGGLVFRYKDNNNYYVFRADSLENSANLYKVIDGKQTKIGGKNLEVTSNTWHVIKVVYDERNIKCYFENNIVADISDDTFDSGSVGLQTKSDSYTMFDDLVIQEIWKKK